MHCNILHTFSLGRGVLDARIIIMTGGVALPGARNGARCTRSNSECATAMHFSVSIIGFAKERSRSSRSPHGTATEKKKQQRRQRQYIADAWGN